MPMFSEPLFEFRVRQTQDGQAVVNLFYYRHDDSTPGVNNPELLIDFTREVHDEMLTVQNEGVLGVDVRLRKVGGANEFIFDSSLQTGLRVGPVTPSFNAWGYKFNRATIDIRNGSKRVAGVSEADTLGNLANPAVLAILEDLALVFAAPIVGTNSSVVLPVIFRRGSFVDPDWFGADIASAAFRSVSSQVSRKQVGGV